MMAMQGCNAITWLLILDQGNDTATRCPLFWEALKRNNGGELYQGNNAAPLFLARPAFFACLLLHLYLDLHSLFFIR